jgi:hypothetical protein
MAGLDTEVNNCDKVNEENKLASSIEKVKVEVNSDHKVQEEGEVQYLEDYVAEESKEVPYESLAVQSPSMLETTLAYAAPEPVETSTSSIYLQPSVEVVDPYFNLAYSSSSEEENNLAEETPKRDYADHIVDDALSEELYLETDPVNTPLEEGDDVTRRASNFLYSMRQALMTAEARFYWQAVHTY